MLTSTTWAQGNSCNSTHLNPSIKDEFVELVDQNLFLLQNKSAETMTNEQIQLNNRNLIFLANALKVLSFDYKPANGSNTGLLLNQIRNNAVVQNTSNYERTDARLGFCFGRATCGHILALRSGYRKEQIKKVWAVGHMKSGFADWAFHVSLIVRDQEGKWWTIDPYIGEVISLNSWYQTMLKINPDKKLQIFITEPEKFGPFAGKYSRMDLGLDGDRQLDYYNGYFRDLMKEFKTSRTQKK